MKKKRLVLGNIREADSKIIYNMMVGKSELGRKIVMKEAVLYRVLEKACL